MKVLVIEHEAAMASSLQHGLRAAGFHVEFANNGRSGLVMAQEGSYHLIIVDLMTPRHNDRNICEELRAQGNRTPIIVLSPRESAGDSIYALDSGADDCVRKPFDFNELLARIRALLRRAHMHYSRTIRVDDLEIESAQHRVSRGGVVIGLTPREYTLLEALAANAGHVLTRETILERVWMSEEASLNAVNVYVGTLRKKIDADHEVKLIHTVYGVGYTLRGSEFMER